MEPPHPPVSSYLGHVTGDPSAPLNLGTFLPFGPALAFQGSSVPVLPPEGTLAII